MESVMSISGLLLELGLTAPRQCLNVIVSSFTNSTVCCCESCGQHDRNTSMDFGDDDDDVMMQCVRSGSDMFNKADDEG